MRHRNTSIRKKIRNVILLVSGILVLVTCVVFSLLEFLSFRRSILQDVATYGSMISKNSTAALAFQSKEEAEDILSALHADPHIRAAAIYDRDGNLFCRYSSGLSTDSLPSKPMSVGYYFTSTSLEGFQPIVQDNKRLGTLFLRSDLDTIQDRLKLYAIIVVAILCFSLLLAFQLSRFLQRGITTPILALAETARIVSDDKDYSVRSTKLSNDEVGLLTDAFNQMLTEIEGRTNALNDFNSNLERMVVERTAELSAANRELESFSYSVSHDLRAPVRSIHSYITIYLEDYGDQLDEEGKKLINIVLRNAQKMGMLIDDLLAFSQLGRKELIKSRIPMNELVRSVWSDCYKPEDKREVNLILGDLPDADAERSTIQQVWVNLISNALKYTRNKPKTIIEIGGERKNGSVVYSVKDNGSGFDMKYYNKLFGVFQRLHSQEEFEGTGVGLAIVERILEKHGGKIWAESVVNENAHFYFTLPLTGE